ncbi:MAG: type VII toxin-antitoxin system HepT family RNase toxin [Candidatus Brocadiales bacterium]
MGIDKEIIAQRISEVQSAISSLEKYAKIDESEFLGDDEKIAAAKYHLISIIEGCISICTHISVKELHKVPDGYATCFKILADNKILSDALATNLAKMVGFRTLLIHRYLQIEDKKVYQYIKTEVGNIQEYLRIVRDKYLRAKG